MRITHEDKTKSPAMYFHEIEGSDRGVWTSAPTPPDYSNLRKAQAKRHG